MQPVMAGCLWLPVNEFDAEHLVKKYTASYKPMGADAPILVPSYVLDTWYVGVPRQDGLKLISKADFVDQRCDGFTARFVKKPTLRGSQPSFVADMLHAAQGEFPDFRAYAATGKGKTVCALSVVAQLGRTALAVVDQEKLMEQWIARAQEHLGLDAGMSFADICKGKGRDIGIVRGDHCDYKGRKFVVAMIQSLSQRDYPDAFYMYPGVVVFDESHTAGAPVLSQVLMQFPARVRFGVSATPDRPDGLNKILKWHLGQVEASMLDKHLPSRVYYMETPTVVSWYANKAKMSGRYIAELSEDAERNRLLSVAIAWLYESGRDVLIVSDRIEQLSNLMALCRARGLPEKDMGLFARYREVWTYQKNPTPARKPKPGEVPMHYAPERKKVTTAELNAVMDKARMVFATYKMFEKGVDLPRLSAGVDATPHARATQVHGRILRTGEDKKLPIWITVRDIWSYRAEYQFLRRLDDYQNSNAEVYLWRPDKGVSKKQVEALSAEVRRRIAYLKPRKIEANADGSFIIL